MVNITRYDAYWHKFNPNFAFLDFLAIAESRAFLALLTGAKYLY